MENTFKRESVEELDAILGHKFHVLDDGFIYVVDYMGSDNSVLRSARVSYGKGTKSISDDKKLLRYLMRHNHSSPFEFPEITFHIRVPIYVWGQWVRHRMSSTNQVSYRYSEVDDAIQKTEDSDWRKQSINNKQGSNGNIQKDIGIFLSGEEENLHKMSQKIYQSRLHLGVAREQARKDMPQSVYTECYWKIDLRNLLHFLELRMDQHAQQEIREYANIICNEILAKWCPLTYEAFNDYKLGKLEFSGIEYYILKFINQNKFYEAQMYMKEIGWLDRNNNGELKSFREREEFENKLKLIGINFEWTI